MVLGILRLVCLGFMILGWFWNYRQWGFRGPGLSIDGEGLLFVGFVGLLIMSLREQFIVGMIMAIIIIFGNEMKYKTRSKSLLLEDLTVISGILVLLMPNLWFLTILTILFALAVFVRYAFLPRWNIG